MFPFIDVLKGILQLAPSVLIGGSTFLFFWLMVGVVALMYQRVTDMERKIYGVARNEALEQTISAIFHGFVAGLVGSFILIFVGVSLSSRDTMWVIGLALILMIVDRRLICFSYAGGLVSLSSLAFGWPEVNVPGLMGLVAILHITESLLIRLTGAGCATPVYLKNKNGRVVGGFTLQKFWPVPIVVLVLAFITDRAMLSGLTYMPDWWPLIRSGSMPLDNPNWIFTMVPVVAVIGYGDMAITTTPERRARLSAGYLALYSLTLLGLAIAASHSPIAAWAAALFSPLGHEFVATTMSRRELRGEPLFVPPARGVRVLDVLPGSPAKAVGLKAADIILAVNDTPVNRKTELFEWLHGPGSETYGPAGPTGAGTAGPGWRPHLNLTVRRGGRTISLRASDLRREAGTLGLITVPEEGDDYHVETRGGSLALPILRWLGGRVEWLAAKLSGQARR